jgi:hypothetical protein
MIFHVFGLTSYLKIGIGHYPEAAASDCIGAEHYPEPAAFDC